MAIGLIRSRPPGVPGMWRRELPPTVGVGDGSVRENRSGIGTSLAATFLRMVWARRFLLTGGAGGALGYLFYRKRIALPESFVLELDLANTTLSEKKSSPFARATEKLSASSSSTSSKKTLLLRDATRAIHDAASDARVSGLVAHLGGATLSLAASQELKSAIAAFKELSLIHI